MCRRPSGKLLEVLLTTIEQLEKDTDLGPADPTVTESSASWCSASPNWKALQWTQVPKLENSRRQKAL